MFDMFDYILDFIMGRFIYCPRCLKRLPIRSEVTQDMTCEGCQYLIPLAYITGCQESPPVFVQVFGLPGSGKTTFLDMLGLLIHDMDHVWQESGYYSRPLTQQTVEHTTTLLINRSQGVLAGSTPRRALNQTEVLIFDLRNLPHWGSRTLVIMDHAGEQFAQLNLDLADIPFLQHTPITILLLSLNDLTSAGKRVDDLVNSYLSTLKMYNVPLTRQRRQLIIAFSKADLLANLPPELSNYLSSDNSHLSLINRRGNLQVSEGQLESYLQRMQQISGSIRNWVETLPNGRNMLNMLTDAGVETRFTLISSTGSPLAFTPGGSDLAPRPRRVLDPFFWVLEYYRRRGSRSTVPATLRMILATFSPALRSAWSLLLLVLLFAGSLFASLFLAGLSGGTPDLVRPGLSLLALLVYFLAAQWLTHPGSTGSPPGPRPAVLQQTSPYPARGTTVSLSPQAAGTPPAAPAPVARSVLNASRLALFFSCLAASTVPAAQHMLSQITLGQFLQVFLVGAALFSCFQPSTRMASLSRVTLALIAGCGALLQYSYGSALELQELHLPPASAETYSAITNLISLALLVLAGILLLILTTRRNGWDRFILWLVVLVFAGLQLVFGSWELQQVFPSAGQSFQTVQQVQVVNRILAALLVLLPLPVLVYLYRFTYLDRLPLLILAIACAFQLHFLGNGAILPAGLSLPFAPTDVYLLATPVVSLLAPDRLIAYALLALAGLMTIRWLFGRPPGPFVFLDHAALFLLAVLCSQLQTFPWGAPVPQGSLSPFQANLLAANHIVASALTIQVYLVAGLALFLLLFPLTRQIKRLPWLLHPLSDRIPWLTRQPWYQRCLTLLSKSLVRLKGVLPWSRSRPQTTVRLTQGIAWLRPITAWSRRALAWLRRVLSTLDVVMRVLERLLACTTTLACALLADLYVQIGSSAPQSMGIYPNQLVALFFVIVAIVIICRVKFPLARVDRLLLLLDIILCTLLYLGRALPPLPLAFALQNWSAAASYSSVPILLFVSLCSATALISFWWAERSPFPGDRRLLHILFTLALVGGFLQLLSSALLVTLLALQTLVMGMAIATIGARSNRTGAE